MSSDILKDTKDTNNNDNDNDNEIDYDSPCNICGDRLGNLPIHTLECNHHFHYECILKSFQTSQEHNNVCPYCRHTIERLPVVNGLKKLTRGIHYITEYEKINYNYKNIPCQHVLKSGKNKGELCNKNCIVGSDCCGRHFKKK